jgi:hypothetical protein
MARVCWYAQPDHRMLAPGYGGHHPPGNGDPDIRSTGLSYSLAGPRYECGQWRVWPISWAMVVSDGSLAAPPPTHRPRPVTSGPVKRVAPEGGVVIAIDPGPPKPPRYPAVSVAATLVNGSPVAARARSRQSSGPSAGSRAIVPAGSNSGK